MVGKTVLTIGELQNLLDAVFEYNRRGQVLQLQFLDSGGKQVEVDSIMVDHESVPLTVHTKPESEADELQRILYPLGDIANGANAGGS